MPPPDKKPSIKDKTVLESYLEALTTQPQEDPNNTISGEYEEDGDDEEADTAGVTYFVDEEGRYYYQAAGDTQNIVALPENVSENEGLVEADQMLVEGGGYQTVTLVPSDNGQGEVSYVLVVQEETKPLVNIDIKAEKGNDDVYTFEEEEEEEEEAEDDVHTVSDDDDEVLVKAKPALVVKRAKSTRPHFTCTFCSYTSHRRYLLLRHMKSHSEERPHKCNVCERGFKTLASLQNHVNMHNGVKPHVCKYCNSPFTTSGELVRHVRYKHTHEKPHRCTECDYASVELSKLRRHVRCHTGERPYQCPHCTYASPDTFKLKRHLRTHTGEKPYKCDNCNMCFTQSNSLKAHKLIHNLSEKPVYKCELCPAKCGRKTDLRIHVQKLHTSEMPLKCKRCGKSFPDRYSCKMHNKTHEGEKCFKCELCPYASTTMRHLKSHLLKHTDEKPFACQLCDQTFRQKQLLRRHQNLYHNPEYVAKPPKEKTHTCHECRRTFARKGNLIRHLAVHDPDSGHQERALALKLGRQRKAKYVDGNMMEEESENESSDVVNIDVNADLKRGELVTVADGDGQQYVVLEVIQLEDGTEQQVAVVAHELMDTEEPEDEDDDEEEEPEGVAADDDDDDDEEDDENMDTKSRVFTKEELQQKAVEQSIKLEKEVDTCFGFDEEDEDDDDSSREQFVLQLVN